MGWCENICCVCNNKKNKLGKLKTQLCFKIKKNLFNPSNFHFIQKKKYIYREVIIIVSFTFPCQVRLMPREWKYYASLSDARILVQNGDFKFCEQRANLIFDESIQTK